MIPVTRSLVAPDALTAVIRQSYGLDVVDCVLVRSLVDDSYLVRTFDRRYVLKLYRHDPWSAGEVGWELDLVAHLAACGLQVAPVRPLTDGRLFGEVTAPEGVRPFALSTYLDGTTPRPPFDDQLYRDFGQLVARFHEATATFHSPSPRRPFDLAATLHEVLESVLPKLADQPGDQALVRVLGSEARHRVTKLAARGLDWGVCHGDVTLDTVLRTRQGLALHDFGSAGERWRASDLAGAHRTAHWEAFATGYTRVRKLPSNDLAALPWFGVLGSILNLRFHLVDKAALRGTESLAEGRAEQELAALRAIADELL